MRIDVLIHPYYSEFVRLPGMVPTLDREQKTQRWYEAMNELGKEDYLIVVSCARTPLQQQLTDRLLEHGRTIPATLVHYHNSIPESVTEGLTSKATRIRGYGELYRFCVDYWTQYVGDKLGFSLFEVELPRELSVGLEIK